MAAPSIYSPRNSKPVCFIGGRTCVRLEKKLKTELVSGLMVRTMDARVSGVWRQKERRPSLERLESLCELRACLCVRVSQETACKEM